MANIIDTLIVALKLDASSLDKGASGAGAKLKGLESQGAKTSGEVKKLGDTSKSSASAVGELGSAVGKFLALLGGTYAIKAFVSDLIDSSAALDRLSKNLNVSAGEITAWGNAAEELGGKASGVQASMSMLSKAQTQIAITGESSLVPYFNFLGVSLASADGKARKVTDVLADLSSVAQGRDRQTMHNVFAEMGFDEGTINLMLAGRKELDLSLRKQKEYAAQMSKFAPEATKLQHSLVDIKQQFSLLGLSLVSQAAPALEKILGWFERIGSWVQNHQQFIVDFLKVMAVGIAALGLAALPLDPLVIAIGAVGLAIAALWDDFQTFQKGGQSLIPWDKWKPGIDLAIEAAKTLGKVWVTELQAIAAAVVFVQKALAGDWEGAKRALASRTEKMNEKWGIAGPDEAHDQNAGKANALVSKGVKLVKEVVHNVTTQPAGFETGYKPGAVSSAIAQREGFNARGPKPNRGQRNHNPGNIEYGQFAKDHGATGSDGRFAIFPDAATGYKALDALLATKAYAGLTIDQAIAKYAPSNENDTASYAAGVRKQVGATATTTVAQAQAFNGTPGAANALRGIPGASSNLSRAGSTPGSSSTTTSDNRVTNTVGSVTINAPSGDANGIAQAFRSLNIFPAVAVAGLR